MSKRTLDPSLRVLERELRTYEQRKAEWLASHSGQFVLLKGTEVAGWFDTELAAYTAGVRRFGTVAFLVRRVQETEPSVAAPAYTLGLLHADP